MSSTLSNYDAFVIGSGPNGLAAAIALAQQGLKVKIFEAKDTVGGGTRTLELMESGFKHDICSAVHPTALSSPFFKNLPLKDYGLEWIHPDFPVAHPLDNGEAVIAEKSFKNTLERLGADSKNYRKLFKDFIDSWEYLSEDLFGTLRIPDHPLAMMRFGWYGMFSSNLLSSSFFKLERTKAYFAGLAAHSILPLENAFTASFGLVLGTTVHSVGWPIAKNGSHSITKALAGFFQFLGGEIELNTHIQSLDEFPSDKPILFDLTPQQVITIADNKIPDSLKDKLLRYNYGPGAFKVDFALSEPVPWLNDECKKAGTLHLGGFMQEIAHSEKEVWKGIHSEKPYVLVSQPSLFDESRAPEGKYVLWSYCHVPNGSTKNMEERIINQIERYAPGFRDIIISTSTMNAMDFEKYNPNYIGGDINGGAQNLKQLFGRPLLKWDPYKLPVDHLYICSSSTPPGGGVHGMSGFNAARSVLKNEFGIKLTL
ncbi:MAG: NAD(P)/FAD-dependent oxidoreductase [Balneola sp.]|nr:NAD(P)/FAD-dependent oxidoreductase [Balneola sp.]MBO6651881.1 NAD(P)/FAD-dependent oxidoreductase [Balneola sp.]MBO6710400.1 NAD(P)/FAD-dependent oxidoreductase [Balneola sp.]MBO6799085.1 NAD(P)/FAD-dependent oxidoreductase [Balneola sp.]MBO6870925.1 NAD(P)/FAD-dependent oxidoreductase [Balneola sp.]